MTAWIETLGAQVDEASARLISAFSRVAHEVRGLERSLDDTFERVGRLEVSREQRAATDLHARVAAAFQAGDFEGLTRREQRYAAKRIESASATQMRGLLSAHPGVWRTFAAECLRRWDELVLRRGRDDYARLLAHAPADLEFLHRNAPITGLIVDGVNTIAAQLQATDLTQARRQLEARGLDASWAFTGATLAVWSLLQVQRGDSFDALYGAVRSDLATETMLLPRRRGTGGVELASWFSNARRSPRFRSSSYAQAVFIAALLQADDRAPAAGAAGFIEVLLQSELGDPRIPPLSEGWKQLEQIEPRLYRKLVQRLVSEDLTIFFDHAMSDPRRRRFWLRYLSSVRRTVCILDASMHVDLRRRLAGTDKALAAALTRAHRFTRNGAGPQAFCLYFDRVVVIEFSEIGNAAFLYRPTDFERKFEPQVRDNRLHGHSGLKDGNLALDKIIHSQARWEELAEDKLRRLGILPDRYR